jgi:dienelactone hydrolase
MASAMDGAAGRLWRGMRSRRRVAGGYVRQELLWRRAPGQLSACALRLGLIPLLGAALICACVVSSNSVAWVMDGSVSVPWRAGNAELFQVGMPEENGARAAHGTLPVRIYHPGSAGPFPFVVLLHGCGGLHREAMWRGWVEPWAELFREHGIGTAIVDSFSPRGVDQVCTGNVALWAVRRTDDAYSVRAWLAEQPYADAKRIAVMGMSNGGRTVLAALRTTLKHPAPFAAGVALYPGCQSDLDSRFYAPLLVLAGRADTVAPVVHCETMKSRQPSDAGSTLDLIIYPRAPHTFDMRLPDRTVLGMRLGYDAEAAADARRRVLDFLVAALSMGLRQ